MGSKRKKPAVKEDENEDEYEVEAIRDKRVHRRGIDYLVKWKGYTECTWVKESDLSCDDLVAAFEAKGKTAPSKAKKRAKVTPMPRHVHGDHDLEESKSDSSSPSQSSVGATPSSPRALELDPDQSAGGDDDDGDCASDPDCDYGLEKGHEAPAVEAILKKRLRGNTVEYLVKRVGLDEPEWQPASGLEERKEFELGLRGANAQHAPMELSPTDTMDRPRAPGKQKARAGQPLVGAATPTRAGRATTTGGKKKKTSRTDGLERTFLGKLVAFSPAYDKWLKDKTYEDVGAAYIVGRVSDYRYMTKQGLYEIRWLESKFQNRVEKISVAIVKQGFENYKRLGAQTSVTRWQQLCRPDPDDAVEIDEDVQHLVEYEEFDTKQTAPTSLAEVEKIQSMRFTPEAAMRAPTTLYSHDDGTNLTRPKPEYRHIFEHSASSSFFAYLPVYYWRQVLEHTNCQARINKVPVPFTMDELMKFLGIIWYMALVRKGEYANYWGEQIEDAIFTTTRSNLDNIMSLRRFKQLRSAFCFRNPRSITPDELRVDAAVRIRTLLNMLKQTGGKYVEVGRNLAVDEASVAARSKFARHMIVFNPTKPTGKYHFKFYMCCCATTWIALSYRLHCESTIEQRATGVHDATNTELLADEMSITSKTRQIVLEITRPFHGSGRIVNCDNYYTSVQLLEALRIKRLFCRGTVKQLSKHFPRHVVLPDPRKREKDTNKSKQKRSRGDDDSGSEQDLGDQSEPLDRVEAGDRTPRAGGEVKRGDYLQAVCTDSKILAASWCDGNIVTIISNADTSSISSVERQIRGEKVSVQAPTAIKEYNQHMQGVDRNDQLRARFSVADGHSFKKWHKKLAFAVIDIARVNAYLTRRLCLNDTRPERDSHRAFVTDLIREMLHGKWQDAMGDEAMLYEGAVSSTPRSNERSPWQSPSSQPARSPSLGSPANTSEVCTDMSSAHVFKGQRRKRTCIVCRFEGRADTTITTVCLKHNVSLCKRTYGEDTRGYGCQRHDWSCWEKYHQYYLPQGTFSDAGCVVRSSTDYRNKSACIEHSEVVSDRLVQRSLTFAPMVESPSTAASTPAPSEARTPATPFTPSTPGSNISDTASHDYI